MRDIAAAAGVAIQTVFTQGSKASLLLACVDRAVVGDDEDVPLASRDLFSRLLGDTGWAEKLHTFRRIVLETTPRAAPIMRVFSGSAAAEPEIAEAWAEYGRRRYQDSRILIGAFERWLRPDLDVDRAADIFWAVFTHDTDDALIRQRGWTLELYADWLVDATERLLLTPVG